MKYNYSLVIVILVCIYISYANVHKYKTELAKAENAAAINDFLNKSGGGSGVNDEPFTEKGRILHTSGERSQEPAKILSDNSKVHTMYDGYGNKTEARCFNNHPRITCIVLSSTTNGQRRVLVYGQNGDIMDLPENMLDQMMTATADEIANSAGIYTARPRTTQTEYAQTTGTSTLPARPVEQNQASIQSLQTEQTETKNTDNSRPAADNSEIKSAPPVENIQPKENEKSASNRSSEEKK